MIIYMATNKINSHKYIGQTVKTLKRRKQDHILTAMREVTNMYFHRALRRYKPENFIWEILRECNNIEELNRLEVYYIGLYNTFNNGYNLTLGGGGSLGYLPSEETKQRMSKSNMGKNVGNQYAKGNTHTLPEETKQRMCKAGKGKHHHIGNKNPMYGKHHSTEVKQKISENSTIIKPVIINDRRFRSLAEAAKFMGVTYSTITRRIKKQTEGYRFV